MPSCSPFSSMTRISRARIRSLMRIKDFAERLSSAMVLLQKSPLPASGVFRHSRGHERTLSIALRTVCADSTVRVKRSFEGRLQREFLPA